MNRLSRLVGLTAAVALSACKCSSGTVVVHPDGGADAGPSHDAGNRIQWDGGGYVWFDGGYVLGGGVGPGGFVLDGGNATGQGNGVAVDPDAGGIVLNSQNIQLHSAWIANNSEGWVSKYDTDTGKEVARYYSVIPVDGLGAAVPVSFADKGNNSPSRTAIDLFGNAWVANRAPVGGVQGSVTKIANSLSDCVDRNHNGKIDTSQDLNGDGVIDTNPAAGEFIVPSNPADPSTYDECVLFSTPVGDTAGNVKGRALAISAGFEGTAGDVWVGVFDQSQMLRLDSITGKVLPVTPGNPNGPMSIPLNFGLNQGPYGAAVDGAQRLWVVHYPAGEIQLALIDANTGTLISDQITPPASMAGSDSYGMAIDGKNRVWVAGFNATNGGGPGVPYVYRYDNGPGLTTANGVWTRFDLSAYRSAQGTSFGVPRGIAVDDLGTVWVSGNTNGVGQAAILAGFDSDTGAVHKFGSADFIDATDANSSTSIGVGIDANQNIWVNNYSGNAMRIDRDAGTVLKTAQQTGTLYTYSDFTGYQLRHFTAPNGSYQQDFLGCGPATNFRVLSWDATQAPPTTQVVAYVKVAATLAGLNAPATPQYGPFATSPVDLVAAGVPTTFPYIRVIFVLSSADRQSTPVLRDFTITWDCLGAIG